jgi:hypothetical protein
VKAVLIDPETETVKDIEVECKLEQIQQLLNVRVIEGFWWQSCFVYCDEEGLLHGTRPLYLSVLDGFEQPVAGRLLVLGPPDPKGYETACQKTAQELAQYVTFRQME